MILMRGIFGLIFRKHFFVVARGREFGMERFPSHLHWLLLAPARAGGETRHFCWPALRTQGQPEVQKNHNLIETLAGAALSTPLTIWAWLRALSRSVPEALSLLTAMKAGQKRCMRRENRLISVWQVSGIIHLRTQQMVRSIVLLGRASQIAFGISTRESFALQINCGIEGQENRRYRIEKRKVP
jgi:hypothetical protein